MSAIRSQTPIPESAEATVHWSDEVEHILDSDLVIGLAYLTPAGGVVVSPVTNFALQDRDAGTVTILSSLGAWKKLERMQRNPNVALAFHTRRHGYSQRPEYVLIQGTASFSLTPDRAWLESIGANWERFMGRRDLGPIRNWWTHVYHWERVGVHVAVKRVAVWPELTCEGTPEVFGSQPPTQPPTSQAAPKLGTGPRIDSARRPRRAERMPEKLLGWVEADGFPIVVPVMSLKPTAKGMTLEARAGLIPPGARRAGLTAHWFSAHALGQEQYVYTGWLDVGPAGHPIEYAPHTKASYLLPPSKLLYPALAGGFTRKGYGRARREGFLRPETPPLTLYYVGISHPSNAARLMLEHKHLSFRLVKIRPGFQSIITRLHRFPGQTVPALDIGGRRVQGSVAIAHALDELKPDPPLYPIELRAPIKDAEAWGERELQPVARDIFRWALAEKPELVPVVVSQYLRVRPVWLISKLMARPLASLSRSGGGTEANVRKHLAALPALLKRVEQLLDEGLLGGPLPNAADFQIATSIRAIGLLDDLAPLIDGRLDAYARSIWPTAEEQFPNVLPAEWLAPPGGSATAPAAGQGSLQSTVGSITPLHANST